MWLKNNWKKLVLIAAVFGVLYFLPVSSSRFTNAIGESLKLAQDYAREHVILCLVPAFFIAGAISVFLSNASVVKYLGAGANKIVAYGVASISGSILAVCSCTVLPLFAGIYRMGAGIGPATAFLYSGPAINVLAIILTARVLGMQIGIARAVGAIIFSIVIGLLMHLIYRKEETAKIQNAALLQQDSTERPLWKTVIYFASMVGILVFANWARSGDVRAIFLCCPGGLSSYQVQGQLISQSDDKVVIMDNSGEVHQIPADRNPVVQTVEKNTAYEWIYQQRWLLVGGLLISFILMTLFWYSRNEIHGWLDSTWGYALQILPLLFIGVLIAGFLLGRPAKEGIIPAAWVNAAVGGNSIRANFVAAFAGAFMYFATLTEVPILQGLLGAGMGKGPALALLLAGPALSLPSMLVIRSIMGTQKTIVYVLLVIVMATVSGIIFGAFF